MQLKRAADPNGDRTQQKRSRATRARQFLRVGAVSREDSDDELGFEDHPWEWIYGQSLTSETAKRQQVMTDPTERKDANLNQGTRIIGARMGTFECRIGEIVLLKAEGSHEAWIGLICGFLDENENEDGVKAANFMWFSTEKEIRNKPKKLMDFLPVGKSSRAISGLDRKHKGLISFCRQNEVYITPSWDINPLASINGKAAVFSMSKFLSHYPTGKVPRQSKDYGKIFVCRRGCNTRTATYTHEFIWEEIYSGKEDDIYALIEQIQIETKAIRRKRVDDPEDKDYALEGKDHESDNVTASPRTPKKRSSAIAPGSVTNGTPRQFRTPSNKRVMIKKPLEFTPLGTRILSPGQLSSPFQIARSKLHVSSVPMELPCREVEFSAVYSHLEAAITDGTGSCIYISGTPGTGKTATVREVVAQLNGAVVAEELDDFIFVEINGMKLTDPHQSYSLLWEALKGDRVSPAHALDLLEREFTHPSPRRMPCVVLMDELDQLVTKNQSVMYNFFNWPSMRHSRLIVLAVANTMDLPERTLSNKISSRLGLIRITFPGYTHDQLMKIIQSRLEGVPGKIVDPDAIQFASRKVAAVSGDARRALDICRRAVEIAEAASKDCDPSQLSPIKLTTDGEHRNPSGPTKSGTVTISVVKQAINEATSSPLQQYLRNLSLAAKLFLLAAVARFQTTGIAETDVGEVMEEAKKIGKMATSIPIQKFLLGDTIGELDRQQRPHGRSLVKMSRVSAMGGAAMDLTEAGIIRFEARKGERLGRIRLSIGDEEIKLAYRDDVEVRALGVRLS